MFEMTGPLLLRIIFDAHRLASAPFSASDKPWFLQWAKAAADAFKTIAEFGAPSEQPIDAERLRQNAANDAVGEAIACNVCISAYSRGEILGRLRKTRTAPFQDRETIESLGCGRGRDRD